MPTYKIELKNIKNISSMEMTYPDRPGVYLISGCNGCGKSTLLVSLHRLCDKNAFSNYFSPTPSYKYKGAQITYSIDNEKVVYKKKDIRWPPSPRAKSNIIDRFPPSKSLLITTSGLRFFTQQGDVVGGRLINASDFMKQSMNTVFGTTAFTNLKYKQIRPRHGRQRILPRSNKLYIMDLGRNKYDENSFSLGERLVLNTLELISDAEPQSQILIDEIELALHPTAQANFYTFLQKMAQDKSLYFFISSHSATLVKRSIKTIHLSHVGQGKIEVLTNSYPAFIIGDIGVDENYSPDKIFFVEDYMAAEYLKNIVNGIINEVKINPIYTIIPIGGYPQVVEFIRNYRAIEPDMKKTFALLDEDVKATFTNLKHQNPKDPFIAKFEEEINNKHLDYLDITPEVGFWEWISNDPVYFKNMLSVDPNISLGGWNANQDVRDIEALPQSPNTRQTAKTRLHKLVEKLSARIPLLDEKSIIQIIIGTYVRDKFRNTAWANQQKGKLLPFLRSR